VPFPVRLELFRQMLQQDKVGHDAGQLFCMPRWSIECFASFKL
jgi:hypothetical protein